MFCPALTTAQERSVSMMTTTVTPTSSVRKPSPRNISGPEGKLWSYLRDRGRPERELGPCSLSTLSARLLAEDLGVSERTILYWSSKLRARGLLSTLTYARHTRGMRGGTWRVSIVHAPEMVHRIRQEALTAVVAIRGEWHPLRAWRALWGSMTPLPEPTPTPPAELKGAPAMPARLICQSCGGTSELVPFGDCSENKHPRAGGALQETIQEDPEQDRLDALAVDDDPAARLDILEMHALGIPDPALADPAPRRARNARRMGLAVRWLHGLGLRGRGLRAGRGWVWALFRRLKSWKRTLGTIWKLSKLASTKRSPAGYMLASLKAGFDQFVGEVTPRPQPVRIPRTARPAPRVARGVAVAPRREAQPDASAIGIGDLLAGLV